MTRAKRPIIAFSFLVAWVSLAMADIPRVAIYCPVVDAPARAFADLAEAKLSERKDLLALDRADLDKLIEEQKLSLSGLISPEDAIKTGRLLKVDLFVVLEMVKGARTPYGAVIYDAKSGRRLIDRGLPKGTPEAVADELEKATLQAAEKARNIPEDALVLRVMPVRSVGLSDDLDYLPVAVHALLQRALAQSPKIVLLERFYLGLLNDEGPPAVKTLLGSAAGLELELRRGDKDGSVRVHAAMIAANGKKTLDTAFNAPDAPDAVTDAVLMAIDRQFHLKNTALPTFKPKQEAERFHREAQVLQNSGETVAAIAAAEAARAFADTPEIAATLAGCQLAEAVNLIIGNYPGVFYNRDHFMTTPPENADQGFRLASKAILAQMNALSPAGETRAPAMKAYLYFDWRFFKNWGGFDNTLLRLARASKNLEDQQTGNPEIRRKFQSLARDFTLSLDQSPLDITLKKTDDARFLSIFWAYIRDIQAKVEISRNVNKNTSAWVADVCRLLDPFLKACDQHRNNLYAAYNRLTGKGYCYAFAPGYSINYLMEDCFGRLQVSFQSDSAPLADPGGPFAKTLIACREHPLPIFRIYAAGMDLFASINGYGGPKTAFEPALERFRRDCDRALATGGKVANQPPPLAATYDAIEQILTRVAIASYARAKFDPELEVLSLMARRKEICGDDLDRRINGVKDPQKMDALLKQLEQAIDSPRARVEATSPAGKNPLWTVQAMARKHNVRLRGETTGPLVSAWERRRVLLGPKTNLLTQSVAIDGKEAFFAIHDRNCYSLRRVDLEDGTMERLADIPLGGYTSFIDIEHRGAIGDGYYFLSLHNLGVFVLDLKTKRVKKLSVATGLPSNLTSEIAWLNGKLYATFDTDRGGCFAAIDPVSGACRVLGAAGNRGQASPFDNTTKLIKVMAMLACPESDRLLFGVLEMCQANVPWKDEHRSGLYAFDGATETFKRLSDTHAARIVKVCPANNDTYFLRDNHGRSAELYDAVNGVRTLYDYGGGADAKKRPAKPKVPDVSPNLPARTDMLCPLALIDNYLWTATPFGRLSLATGKLECFPESLKDYTSLVLPVDADGKRVLVSGSCGLVILSPGD